VDLEVKVSSHHCPPRACELFLPLRRPANLSDDVAAGDLLANVNRWLIEVSIEG
jgi:hypothetical protein